MATEVVSLRQEGERLKQNHLTQGIVNVFDRRQASVVVYKSQADLLRASLNYLIAWA